MKISMSKSQIGITREDGAETGTFEIGKEYKSQGKWQEQIFKSFVDMGVAIEIGGNASPTETKAKRKKASK